MGPRPFRNAILGILVGLLLGIGLAFLWEYLDDTLKTREDFEKYYECPIVGEIAYTPPENGEGFEIVYFSRPNLPAVEGYRSLRTNIQFLNMEKGIKTILVTSASPEEGKSTVLVNLAAALSEMGKRVVIIEADLRRPMLQKYLGITAAAGPAGSCADKGLTAVLAGTSTLEESICPTDYAGLSVLLSGVEPQPGGAGVLAPHGGTHQGSSRSGGLRTGGRAAYPGHQRRGSHLPHGRRGAAGGQLRPGRPRLLPPLRKPVAQGQSRSARADHQGQRHPLERSFSLLLYQQGEEPARRARPGITSTN